MSLDPIKTLEVALKINRRAATLLIGGFLLLALAAVFGNQVKDSGLTFWHIPVALLIFSVLVAVLARMPEALALVACWTLVILALLFAIGVTGQVLAGNTLPYAKLDCLTGFWKPAACSTSPVDVLQAAVVAEAEASGPTVSETAPARTDVDRGSTTVYIQFAGLERESVQKIARDLVALGWPIEGADQGGERYDHAAGLNEVRFFHPKDQDRAEVLAEDLSRAMGGTSIKVLDVTDSAYAMDTPGHLEIWISQ